jgi:hypothetical protein
LDLSAIGLTAICLVHCLALPPLALVLPLFAAWATAEWVHVLAVTLAAPLALLAMMDWPARRPASWRALVLAIAGLLLMTTAALEVPDAGWERPLPVVGGLFLAARVF